MNKIPTELVYLLIAIPIIRLIYLKLKKNNIKCKINL